MPHIYDKLICKLEAQHMEAALELQRLFTDVDQAYSESLNDLIAFLVAFVITLRGSKRKRREFLDQTFWPKARQEVSDGKLIRLAAMFMVGAKDSHHRRYDSALDYNKLVLHYLDRDVDPAEVAACIAAEGGAHNIIRSLRSTNSDAEKKDRDPEAEAEVLAYPEGGGAEAGNAGDDASDLNDDSSDAADDDSSEADNTAAPPPPLDDEPTKTPEEDVEAKRKVDARARDAAHHAKLMQEIKAIEARGNEALIVEVSGHTLDVTTSIYSSMPPTLDLVKKRGENWTRIEGHLPEIIADDLEQD